MEQMKIKQTQDEHLKQLAITAQDICYQPLDQITLLVEEEEDKEEESILNIAQVCHIHTL
jgi:hypothetical protein